MIIPRHKVCDFCEKPVGVNKRYFVIKSKDYLVGYAGSCSDNRTHHICEDCMGEFKTYLRSKLKGEENKQDGESMDIPIQDNCLNCIHRNVCYKSAWQQAPCKDKI